MKKLKCEDVPADSSMLVLGTMYVVSDEGEDPFPYAKPGTKVLKPRLAFGIDPKTAIAIVSKPWRARAPGGGTNVAVNVLSTNGPFTILAHWLSDYERVRI